MKDRFRDKSSTFGEDFNKDTRAEPDEGCNTYYTRKQRTKASKLAPDCEAEYAPPDRDADQAENFKDPDASFLNYKRWDRYGRS